MKASRNVLVVALGCLTWIVGTAVAASAQTIIDNTQTPLKNTGGWVFGMAVLLSVVGVISVFLVVLGYMRFAPRFARDEDASRSVRADRLRPGEALPRRAVDVGEGPPVVD